VEQPSREGDSEELVGTPTHRVVALADGIFAVAMTLLVLELHVPALGSDISNASLLTALREHVPQILSFMSGFVILGTLWVGHHYQFHYIRRSNRTLLWINLIFLMTISFLPFVVSLLGTYGAMRVTCMLYGAALVLAMTVLLVHWLYASNPARGLVDRHLPPVVFAGLRNRVLMGMIGYGVGIVVALVVPVASVVCYVAMPLLYLLPGRFDRYIRGEE
jgi:uncharacterized membrane protein